jgi:carbon-monoxide dehydrogenase small subunit
VNVALTVNGECVEVDIAPTENLLETLRDGLGLTGTKDACHEGSCGSCTVLFDGAPVYGCLIITSLADGASVETIEGLTAGGRARLVQDALLDAGAVQCGFCTPGFVVSAVALLERSQPPNDEEIRRALEGNLCRCTGYARVVDAVSRASRR